MVTILELPKCNHLFQRAQTGAISEYAKIEETISPIALEAITEWILKQTGQNKTRPEQGRRIGTPD
jgi:hypothetical protein